MSFKLFADAVEFLYPLAFAAFILFRRSHPGPFPSWTKKLAISAAAAGIVVAVLHYLLPHYRELGMTAGAYVALMHFRRILAGVVVGILLSIVVYCTRSGASAKDQAAV